MTEQTPPKAPAPNDRICEASAFFASSWDGACGIFSTTASAAWLVVVLVVDMFV